MSLLYCNAHRCLEPPPPSACGGAFAAPLPRPIDWPRHVRGAFPVVRRSATGANRAARAGAARRTVPARACRASSCRAPTAIRTNIVPPSEERLAWLTGFTGSAGTTVVLGDRAALFVDGRYTLQAGDQVDPAIFSIVHIAETAARALARSESAGRRQARLRPVAAHRRRRRAAGARLRQRRRDAGAGGAQSDRRDLDRPAGAAARRRCRCTICALPANTPAPSSRASAPRSQACAPTRW